jgi:hypothetical protein
MTDKQNTLARVTTARGSSWDGAAPDDSHRHGADDDTPKNASETNGINFLLRHVSILASPILVNDEQVAVYGSYRDISERIRSEKERDRLIRELQEALTKVKTLRGLIPICASCKRIRDDKRYWNQIEAHLRKHSDADFSHGFCPECIGRLYPDFNKNG